MTEVVIADNIDIVNEDKYKFIVDMIDISTILINIMNTDTGINYKLYIKKDDKWYINNSHKIQNDFSQLYKLIEDCLTNQDSEFEYKLLEEKDEINLKINMKKQSQFFKLELEFVLPRYISENGIVDDRLNSLEYQINKIRKSVCVEHDLKTLYDNIKIIEENLSDISDKLHNRSSNKDNKIYNEYGNLIYKGGIVNGKREGKGIEFCPISGQILYNGEFKNGYYHGNGTLYMYCSNPSMRLNNYYQGNFNKGLFDGNIDVYCNLDACNPLDINITDTYTYKEGQRVRSFNHSSGKTTNYEIELTSIVNKAILESN